MRTETKEEDKKKKKIRGRRKSRRRKRSGWRPQNHSCITFSKLHKTRHKVLHPGGKSSIPPSPLIPLSLILLFRHFYLPSFSTFFPFYLPSCLLSLFLSFHLLYPLLPSFLSLSDLFLLCLPPLFQSPLLLHLSYLSFLRFSFPSSSSCPLGLCFPCFNSASSPHLFLLFPLITSSSPTLLLLPPLLASPFPISFPSTILPFLHFGLLPSLPSPLQSSPVTLRLYKTYQERFLSE